MASRSADSLEALPLITLERRLSEVRRGEFHLRRELPLDNPYNAVLRFTDILRYIDVQAWEVFSMFPGLERVYNRMKPDRKPNLKKKVTGRKDELQLRLSQFFHGWDNGSLLKRCVGSKWLIVGRHDGEGLAKMDAAPRPQADARSIKMRIDLTTLGPKLKGV
jgi:hypothetical protein